MRKDDGDLTEVAVAVLVAGIIAAAILYVIVVDILSWPLAGLGVSLRHNRWTSPGPFDMPLTRSLYRALS